MQSEIESYLDTLCGEIRCKYARRLVREEIKIHIEDNKKEGESRGMDRIEAEKKAAQAMGDPEEVGRMMDKLHRPKTDILMLISISVLLFFGLAVFTVRHTSYIGIKGVLEMISGRPTIMLFRVIGIAAFILCLFVDLRSLLKKNIFIIIAGLIGIAGLLFINLTSKQHRFWEMPNEWISFISYICICLFVISFAGLLSRFRKKSWFTVIAAAGIALSAACIMLFRENGQRILAMCMLASFAVMFWFTNIKLPWKIIISVAIVAFMVNYSIKNSEYKNVLAYLGGFDKYDEELTALLNEGLANIQIIGAVPGAAEIFFANHVVFILLNFGILPLALLITSLAVLVWRLIRVCIRIRDTQGRVLATGLAAFITISVTASLLLTPLLIRSSGSYMPFLGSGPEFVLFSVFLGLIAGLYRRKDLYTAKDTAPLDKTRPHMIETA